MLNIVATPIGNFSDISLRALEVLKTCNIVIGEEHRVASTLLKKLGLEQKEIYLLNEHTKKNDLEELAELCASQNVALVSDCGTPGFSDPGADLIAICRRKKIKMTSLPGASSLMTLLSLSSQKLTEFIFVGFLPAKNEERIKALQELKRESRPWILMDTPYRLKAILKDLASLYPADSALLCLNLTQVDEEIIEGSFTEIEKKCTKESAEFMILKYETKPKIERCPR
jgi:16S rRNA (cytidine1402-2'-O)-methyltransferase